MGLVVPIERVCANCGGEITLPPHPGARRKYCSMSCATEANNRPLRRICPECGDRMVCKGCGWTPD